MSEENMDIGLERGIRTRLCFAPASDFTLSDNYDTVLPSLPFIPVVNCSIVEFKVHLRESSAEGISHKRPGPDL